MSNQTKKTPISTKLMMETKEYLENKEALNKRINHNSVYSNTLLLSVGSNLIDFEHRKEVFRNWDKKACKEAKKEWQSQSPESVGKGRNAILLQLASSEIPNWNLKISSIN